MNSIRILKALIWLYFWLLIFEGALRKWVLPGLATPLLIVRDPIVMLALLVALFSGKLKVNFTLGAMGFVAFLAPVLAMVAGHGNAAVTVFGWRCNFLHLPFLFVMGSVLDAEDVKKMARWLLLLSIPMVLLMADQFHSPPGSFVNIGLGGDGDSGFDGAMGYRRPSATFSFTNGVSAFFPLVAAFVLHRMIQPEVKGKWLAIAAGLATLAAIPLSISRALFMGEGLAVVGAVVALFASGRSISRLLTAGVTVAFVAVAASFLPGMEKPREAFLSRWDESTTAKGGFQEAIVNRAVSEPLSGILPTNGNYLAGAGLGSGTNAGAQLLVGSNKAFLVSEGEWGRLTGEMGLPLGLLFILIRVGLALTLFVVAWKAARRGESLALIVWFTGAMGLSMGQWGQPTSLGFAIFQGGLVLALSRPRARVPVMRQVAQPVRVMGVQPRIARPPHYYRNA